MMETIRKFVKYREQTHREQTDREFNYRGHSNPSWIMGLSGPITDTAFKKVFVHSNGDRIMFKT